MTSKQRAYLRSMASKFDAIFQIGKGEVTENMLEAISNALEARELIKISLLETCEYTVRDAAEAVAEATDSQVVTVIGRKFILYRESKKHKKILLDEI